MKARRSASDTRGGNEIEWGQLVQKYGRYIAVLGGFFVVLGSFLPWITITHVFGSASKNGIDGDGKFTLALGLLIIVGAFRGFGKAGSRAVVAVVFSAITLALGVFEYIDVQSTIDEATTEYSYASVSGGLYLVLVGSLLGLFGWARNPTIEIPQASQACPGCFAAIEDKARFCHACGRALEQSDEPA